MISEDRQTVTSTTSAIIIFRALKFCSGEVVALTIVSLVSTGLDGVQLLPADNK
jgi:hypothetical protein